MKTDLFQVNAFTNHPCKGNPAGICLASFSSTHDIDLSNTIWMQRLAKKMGLSETAFLQKGKDMYNLRWFTPICEVDLCGHATLASARVLWETGRLSPNEQAHFNTRSGLLTAKKVQNFIELDFPAEPETEMDPPSDLIKALGCSLIYTGKNRFDYLVEIDSEKEICTIHPDLERLRKLPIHSVIVTAQSATPQYDFVSRFFAPSAGIDEDPVTGSAHCCLGPYWSQKLHKKEMKAYQASSRGGEIVVRIENNRTVLKGQAVIVNQKTRTQHE